MKSLWALVNNLSGTCSMLVRTHQTLTHDHFNDYFSYNVKNIFMNKIYK